MKAIRVIGPSETGKTELVERIVERLSDRGRVGTVKHIDCEPDLDTAGKDTARHREAGSDLTYGIGESEWFATGQERTLADALEDLAVDCDYAVVEGYGESDLPAVVLGDGPAVEEPIAAGASATDIDVDAVVAATEEIEPYETLESLVARAKASPTAERAGAIATFTGRVRTRDDPDEPATEYLEFERYDGVAQQRMAEIREQLEERDGVFEVLLHHRTGVVEAGEDIVFVVVLAGHRSEAFETVEDGIDRLKAEVPLFKKEVTTAGEFWAHQHDR